MCVLRVIGAQSFDATGYLRESGLTPCKVFEAGTPRLPKSRPDGPTHATSGFTVAVSDAEWSDLACQIRDARAFLALHERELRALSRLADIQDVRLDFAVELRIDGNAVITQSEFFPADFLGLVGRVGLGLEFSIYPGTDEEDDDSVVA
jgi:hypothetical protein